MRTLPFIFILTVLLINAGCGMRSSNERAADREDSSDTSRDGNLPSMAKPDGQINVPVRIVVFQDKSGSVNNARITQFTEDDLRFFVNVLREKSGELAFGIIDEDSNKPLVRLRLDMPRPRPVKPVSNNAFEQAELMAAYEVELENYNKVMQEREAVSNSRIEAFMSQIKPMLVQRVAAKSTNIYDGLARINLFIHEPESGWPSPPHRYVVINTDGIHTAGAKPVKLESQVKLLLINGIGSAGVLESANPVKFESIQAALDFIADTELGRRK